MVSHLKYFSAPNEYGKHYPNEVVQFDRKAVLIERIFANELLSGVNDNVQLAFHLHLPDNILELRSPVGSNDSVEQMVFDFQKQYSNELYQILRPETNILQAALIKFADNIFIEVIRPDIINVMFNGAAHTHKSYLSALAFVNQINKP